jgi:hypothetical protein
VQSIALLYLGINSLEDKLRIARGMKVLQRKRLQTALWLINSEKQLPKNSYTKSQNSRVNQDNFGV